ncbi:MAG TPA: hypothetical protein VHR72_15100 [Gemmataceae bacterium]|jgi:hypothetical protein|nr:hypothetical protein [Gemmataceae bacterium]
MRGLSLRFAALFVGLLGAVGLTTSSSADGPKKPTRPATEVEVQFANGSAVKMVLADTPIEIQTPYGKLAVPARDLRKIDFGVHLPEGLDKQIDQAVAELGNENFRVREAASVSLMKHGAHALPALVEASKSTDLELSKRAKALVAKMHQDLPAKDLRTHTTDTIVTPTFTVVGRILTASLKAKADYFGTVQLDLVELRTLRSTDSPAEVLVTVDGHYAAQGQQEWLATEFVFDGRSKIVISATGQIDLFPQNGAGDQFVSTPKGNFNGGAGMFIGGKGGVRQRVRPGTLIGRIGESGDPFVIGENYEGAPSREGKLYLQVASSPWSNECSGSYSVKITTKN